ncbi:hypothetical protein BEN60_gp063 [Gordonia phage Smoothie]|uniref:Uncharacterized protein n=1 Tax=Gordonia phage Smoothie TaxID=1838078 RepID=A0A160DEI0_9CAUD|nr:hypothetical protein BEN60_gp063 [Gordonia phage Smoothie]ANA86300.1 hypothetical protein PBI_SMOOTHIE_144 [Gordonia phage Smoothie]QYC53624.1 hypothetical protein SEA_NORVS_140 [Gordonia phage Norvs]WKW85939.1 hypothetical protein SEA_PHINKBODEN_140 [Gordonia Phage PhinkBoden]
MIEDEAREAFEQNFPTVEWTTSRWTFMEDYR